MNSKHQTSCLARYFCIELKRIDEDVKSLFKSVATSLIAGNAERKVVECQSDANARRIKNCKAI